MLFNNISIKHISKRNEIKEYNTYKKDKNE